MTGQRVTKVIVMIPLGDMNVCTTFSHNQSNNCYINFTFPPKCQTHVGTKGNVRHPKAADISSGDMDVCTLHSICLFDCFSFCVSILYFAVMRVVKKTIEHSLAFSIYFSVWHTLLTDALLCAVSPLKLRRSSDRGRQDLMGHSGPTNSPGKVAWTETVTLEFESL